MKASIDMSYLLRTFAASLTLIAAVMCAPTVTAKVYGTHSGGVCNVTDNAGVSAAIACGGGVSQAQCNADGSCSVGALVGTVGGGTGDQRATAQAARPCPSYANDPCELPGKANLAPPKKALDIAAPIPQCATVRRDLVNKPGAAPVDVNAAPRDALIKVPGISSTAAQQIISERSKAKFANWDDVLQRTEAMRCIDFTGSPMQVMGRPFNPRNHDPKSPGW